MYYFGHFNLISHLGVFLKSNKKIGILEFTIFFILNRPN